MAALEALLDELEPFARVSRDEVLGRVDEICETFVAISERDARAPTNARRRKALEDLAAALTSARVKMENLSDDDLLALRGGPLGRGVDDAAQTERLPLPRFWPAEYREPRHDGPSWVEGLAALSELVRAEARGVPADPGGARNTYREREGNPDLWLVRECGWLFRECYPDKLTSTEGGVFHRFCLEVRARAVGVTNQTNALLHHVRDVARWLHLCDSHDRLQQTRADDSETRELDQVRRELDELVAKSPLLRRASRF